VQVILFFASIVLTGMLTGFLAWYAWRQRDVRGSRAYAAMALGECLLAVAETLSMLGPGQPQALFWFKVRFFFTAIIPVLWLVFTLEYSGRKDWLSRRLLALAFFLPALTQIVVWSNSRYGLWVKQEVGFHQSGPFWLAETSARIPGLWFMIHSFYSLLLLLTGIVVILIAAWGKRRPYRGQALLLSAGAIIALATSIIPIFNLIPQAEFNPFIPGIGVSALLYALAIFCFQFLKPAPDAGVMTNSNAQGLQDRRSVGLFVLIFLLLVSGIGAAGYVSYESYERQFRAQVEKQLSAIAELKGRGLEEWRAERLADAQVIRENPAFAALVEETVANPPDAQAEGQLQLWINSLRSAYGYDRASVLDPGGAERLSSPKEPEQVAAHLVQDAAAVLQSGQVTFLDLHRDAEGGAIRLAVLVPVLAGGETNRPLGVLVLRIDPDTYLYPYLAQWPTPGQTSETLLVRRDGENVLYLNPLRFRPDAALNLRIPLSTTDNLAVRAVLGQSGVVEGVDYRGETVIGAIRAIHDSPWLLVARMDTVEVYAPLRERLLQTYAVLGTIVAAAGVGLWLVWRQQRLRYYRSRYQSAEALRASEERFRKAFLIIPDAVAITCLSDGRFVSANPGFTKILGYAESDVVGKSSLELEIWDDPQARNELVARLQAHGVVDNYEAAFRTKTGELRHGLMSAAIIELDGEPHILNTTRDITERRRIEEALRESEARFRRAVEEAPFPMLIHADDGAIVSMSRTWSEISGYTKEDIPTIAAWTERAYGERKEAVRADIDELYDLTRRKAEGEYRIRCKDGSERVWDFSSVGLGRLPDGRRIVISIASDITERKRAEEALQKVLADLERSNLELEQFAYVASHDLQEPLRMVSSYTQLLAKRYSDQLDQDAHDFIAYIVDGAGRMQRMIHDLLTYSRVATRAHPYEPVDLNQALGEAQGNLRAAIDESAAQVSSGDLPTVDGDRTQLVQVLQNLLANAIKFRKKDEPPRVNVSARRDGAEWIISVKDNGIGIEPQQFRRLFVLFQRLHGPQEYPGTGIGLALCRRIIARHGGRIWGESAPGEGAEFSFSLNA
jgi:PAS domain S-box-containing protein